MASNSINFTNLAFAFCNTPALKCVSLSRMEINYTDIAKFEQSGKRATLCIIVSSEGNTPRHAGSKMIVFEDGTTVGTVGGGNIELEAIQVALKGVTKPYWQTFHLLGDAGMICGGTVTIYFEPLLSRPKLYIFGGGHVGQAIVKIGSNMGFDIIVVDNRAELLSYLEGTNAKLWTMDYLQAIEKIVFDTNSYFVITTPRHQYDETILAAIAQKPHKYIGMMASKEKVAAVRKKFIENKILPQEILDSIDMPIGIPIRCETPVDIAISVWARIIDLKNKSDYE